MGRRRQTRTREPWPPKAPFDYGQTVKIKLSDGSIKVGKVTLVGWILFPGAHSFDVEVEGTRYTTHGGNHLGGDRPSIRALTADMDEEL